jgi:hypothetical protein
VDHGRADRWSRCADSAAALPAQLEHDQEHAGEQLAGRVRHGRRQAAGEGAVIAVLVETLSILRRRGAALGHVPQHAGGIRHVHDP